MADFSENARARGPQGPRALALELTKGCNLRCAYCYYAEREEAYDPRTRMSADVARRSVDLLADEGPADQPFHLHFFGGEPLLNFPLLQETVLYAEQRARDRDRQVTFEVTTNGTLLTDEVIAFLNEHRVHVGVSFDGPPDIQDAARPASRGSSHAMAEPGIRRLLASRAGGELERRTHCSVVVTRAETDMLRIVEHLEGLGFRDIILTPATDLEGKTNGLREEDLAEAFAAYDALAGDYEARVRAGRPVPANWFPNLMGRLLSGERRQRFCGGGRDYLGVAASGELSLCYRFFEDPEHAMGSVQEGLDRGVTERLDAARLDTRTTCSRCWARYFCGGGCHHDNVTASGSVGEPNPITCDLFRHSMGRTLEMWARLSRDGHLGARAPVSTLAPPAGAPQTPAMDPASESIEDDHRPRCASGCHVRELEGEKIVYDPRSHEVVVLNPTAAYIFGLCDGERTVGDVLALLGERYDAPLEILRRDLIGVLTDLRAKHLLT